MEQTEHHTGSESLDIILQGLGEEFLRATPGKPSSQRVRRQALSHWQQFLMGEGVRRLQDITPGELEGWRRQLEQNGMAAATVELYSRSVRQFFNWLEQKQWLFLNPAAEFLVPKTTRPNSTVLTQEQVQRLLSQPDQATPVGLRDRALLALLYSTGTTRHELLGLRCQDVTATAVELRNPKRRSVPLDSHTAQALARYMNEARPKLLANHTTSAMWLCREGTPLLPETLRQVFMRHSTGAGLGCVSASALRRAGIVHRWQSGIHPVRLQLLMGYASLRTLSQFLRVTVTELFQPFKEMARAEAEIA